jgi:hypothetical protein
MPKGVKGSGKAKPARAAQNGSSDAMRVDEEHEAFGSPSRADNVPRCRTAGCGAMLAPGGQCPACAFRARKYAKLFEIQNPNCECGAPRVATKPNARMLPRRCALCRRLRAKAKAKGIAV